MYDNTSKFELFKSTDKNKQVEFDHHSTIKENLLKIKNENLKLKKNILNKDFEISILNTQVSKIKNRFKNFENPDHDNEPNQLKNNFNLDYFENNEKKVEKTINIYSRNSYMDISKMHLNFNNFNDKGLNEYKTFNRNSYATDNYYKKKHESEEESNELSPFKPNTKNKNVKKKLKELDNIQFTNSYLKNNISNSKHGQFCSNSNHNDDNLKFDQQIKLIENGNILSSQLNSNSKAILEFKRNNNDNTANEYYKENGKYSYNKTLNNDNFKEVSDNTNSNLILNINNNSYSKNTNQTKLPEIINHELVNTNTNNIYNNYNYNNSINLKENKKTDYIKESVKALTTEKSITEDLCLSKNNKQLIMLDKPNEKSKSRNFNNELSKFKGSKSNFPPVDLIKNKDLTVELNETYEIIPNIPLSKRNKENENIASNLIEHNVYLNNQIKVIPYNPNYNEKINNLLKEENLKLAKISIECNKKLVEINSKYIKVVNELNLLKIEFKSKVETLMKSLEVAITNFARLQKVVNGQNEILKMGKESQDKNHSKSYNINYL